MSVSGLIKKKIKRAFDHRLQARKFRYALQFFFFLLLKKISIKADSAEMQLEPGSA